MDRQRDSESSTGQGKTRSVEFSTRGASRKLVASTGRSQTVSHQSGLSSDKKGAQALVGGVSIDKGDAEPKGLVNLGVPICES